MILFVGRLSWEKGARNVLLAIPSVLKEYSNTMLVILGIGGEQRDIVETAIRLNIRNNIMYSFDFVPDPERARAIWSSKLCIVNGLQIQYALTG